MERNGKARNGKVWMCKARQGEDLIVGGRIEIKSMEWNGVEWNGVVRLGDAGQGNYFDEGEMK